LAARSAKLRARFELCLRSSELSAAAGRGRAAIKARSRRLITTAFVALAATGPRRDQGLAASRAVLRQFAAASSWKERPAIRSFLDCAEIAVAVALAYDWLYDLLPADERGAIERAMLRNALEPAAAAYRDPSALWPNRRDNCALVSNGGIAIAALAMLSPYRELATGLVQSSLASAWNAFAAFAPDEA
jgi:hypothetical protein